MNKYLSIISSLLVLVLVLIFSACDKEMSEVRRTVSPEELKYEKAKDVTLLYSDSAIVKIRIKAPVMWYFADGKDRRREFPEGVEVDFFDSNKRPTSHLIANFATHIENEKQVILRDSVVVWNIKDERLWTEELIWDEQKELIRSDKIVTVVTATDSIRGRDFISNLDFTEWEINDVVGYAEVENITEETPSQ